MILICDLDGSIADWGRRADEAGAEPDRTANPELHDDWCKAIQNAESLAADPTIPLMVRTVQGIARLCKQVIYLTARTAEYEAITSHWLGAKGFPKGALICRAQDDKRPTVEFKAALIANLKVLHPKEKFLTLDDDPTGTCAPIYRALGVVHLKPTWCMFDETGKKREAYT